MSFNEKLHELRKEKGYSQEGLAEVLGVSRQAVAKWEAGSNYPEVDKLISISNLFRVSIDKLLKNIEDECSEPLKKVRCREDYIKEFLCRAKRITYAGSGCKSPSTRPNSHDMIYCEDNLKYIDTYLGGERFSGEEGVWIDNVPYWAMNYTGRVIGEGFSGSFLKEVLKNVKEDKPFRGPMIYQKGEFKYHCIVNGNFDFFYGYEEIYLRENKIYECIFHGGMIS